MAVSRRHVLTALGSSALLARPRFVLAQGIDDGFAVLRVEQRQEQLLAEGGQPTKTWRFLKDGAIPVLQARQGEELKLRFINLLDVEIWLHWYGVRGPDSVMTLNIPPGAENATDCVFTPPDAGCFWFGPLIDASRQRDMGLYGMLVVKSPADDALFDQPMILDDWKLGDDGAIIEDFGNLQAAIGEGRLGNWFTVNDRYRPDISLPANKLVRLRLLNAANVRTMRLLFKGPSPWLAALDGQPVPVTRLGDEALSLAPGQRADLLLDSSSEELTVGLDLFEETAELCHITRLGAPGVALVSPGFSLPANPIGTRLTLEGARHISVVLEGGAKGGLQRAKLNGVELELRALLEQGKAWAINGEVGPAQASIGSFTLGETVVLDIDNRTAFDQPLHLQGHVWQLVEEGGELLKTPQPWRDTTVVPARSLQKLAFLADNKGAWMLHSLVAERCDSGLISAFIVG